MQILHHRGNLLVLLVPTLLCAQSSTQLQQILDRLDRLEQQNRALTDEIRQLRAELAAARETSDEKLAVQERRVEEQAQTKVEASQHYPIRITGMALFNAFRNGDNNGGSDYPTLASFSYGTDNGGATLRQTVLGLDFQGPRTVWGGTVHGNVYMDFFSGTAQNMRIRTGAIEMDWKSRSFMVGLEKPIFNPREPASLAQVGISPLTAAGNLWLWIPQVRFDQELRLGEQTSLRAQIGAVATREQPSYNTLNYSADVQPVRPGVEGRFNLVHRYGDNQRLELAPGFHASASHVGGVSVPSNLVSLDWFANPGRKLEFTGALFSGQNVAHLGTGAIRQGFVFLAPGLVRPVHSKGGWAQWTWLATDRLSFHFFGGIHDDRDADLGPGRIGKNQQYGANLFYRLAPNLLTSFEASQIRTDYLGAGNRLNNHYDLAFAYLF